MEFKEHDNRKEAKKLAEYITGHKLRKYTAEKVKSYLGENPLTIFDGAIGSGQLEQYLNIDRIYGVDIQEKSVLSARSNFDDTEIEIGSFFRYDKEIKVDAVVMNPPFSLEFKSLGEDEKKNIQKEFPWKKSGKVDDMFVLMSLKFTKRYGFYILFPGVGYRTSEQRFREIIGSSLAELNIIHNAFDDTSIPVLFVVIDKEKRSDIYRREIIDFKLDKTVQGEDGVLESDCRWHTAVEEQEKEEIDIEEVNKSLQEIALKQIEYRIEIDLLLNREFGAEINIFSFIRKLRKICDKYEKEIRRKTRCRTKEEALEKLTQYTTQLNLFSQ